MSASDCFYANLCDEMNADSASNNNSGSKSNKVMWILVAWIPTTSNQKIQGVKYVSFIRLVLHHMSVAMAMACVCRCRCADDQY
jgi:hypothetical protein